MKLKHVLQLSLVLISITWASWLQASPTISQQPQSVAKNIGESATFSVVASGSPPLSYQWKKDGANIAGQTTSAYSISSVQNSDAGGYTVFISDSTGSVLSSAAVLSLPTSRTWIGGVGSWFIASNWSPSGVPTTVDMATISSGVVTVSSSATVANLTLTGGTITGTGDLTVTNSLQWQGGTISGTGNTVISSGGTLDFSGDSGKTLEGRSMTINGSATVSGPGNFNFNSGTINVSSGAIFQVTTNWSVSDDGSGATPMFLNAGTFKNYGSATLLQGLDFSNAGTIEVQQGTLSIGSTFNNAGSVLTYGSASMVVSGTGTHTGTFNAVDSATQIGFASGTNTFSTGAALAGSGYFQILSSGVVDLQTNLSVGNILLYDGSLTGSSDLAVSGFFGWYGGTLSGSGSLNLSAPSFLIMSGSTDRTLNGRTVNIDGYADWSGGNIFFESGTINNHSSAFFYIETDASLEDSNPTTTATLNNYGSIVKGSGVGQTIFTGITFNQSGWLEVDRGIIHLGDGFNPASESKLVFQIAGTEPGTNYGQLEVVGGVAFDGTIEVQVGEGFTPAENDAYAVITHDSRTGSFASTNLETLSDGNYFSLSYNSSDVTVAVQKAACTPVPSDMISWWRGENKTEDVLGVNPGYGSLSYTNGKVGKAFSFSEDYLRIYNSSTLQPEHITVELWAKSASPGGYLINKSLAGGHGAYALYTVFGGVQFYVGAGGTYYASPAASSAIWDGNWHHIAGTYDGSSVRLYIDGVEISEGTSASGSIDYTTSYENGDLFIGSFDSNTYFWNGELDEVSIYSRALAPAEIQAINNAGIGGKCQAATAPTITLQPFNVTNNVGNIAVFYVSASGTAPLSYQWKFNGAAMVDGASINGSHASTLLLYNLQTNQEGNYSVVVSNAVGTTTSSNAFLRVTRPPVITSYPSAVTTNSGANVSFPVGISSDLTPVTYQWFKNGSPLSEGSKFSGVTTTNLLISSVQEVDAGTFTLEASNVEGTTSAFAFLTVYSAPTITTQPVNATNNSSATVTFNVTASGGSLCYQWRRGINSSSQTNLTDKGNILGTMTPSLTLSDITAADALSYSVVVSNPAGSVTSSVVKLSVKDPAILVQPQSQGRVLGSTITLSVTAAGTAPLSYQWKKGTTSLVNGSRISGATSSTLTISGLTTGDLGTYKVAVSNPKGTVSSADAVITAAVAPTITSNPTNQIKPPNGTAIFAATVSGSSPLTYRWRKDGANIFDGGTISGATTKTLTITSLTYGDSGDYSLCVTNYGGSATSSAATLLVSNALPVVSILSPENESSFAAPGPIPFIISASDSDGQIDRIEIYNGGTIVGTVSNTVATNTTFTFNATNVPAGNYTFFAVAYDNLGSVNSSGFIYVDVTSECTLPASGILAWWRGENDGNDFYGAHNGTLANGATAYGAGKVGNALTLDGVDDYLEVADSPQLNFANGSQLTVEMWAYRIGGSGVQHLLGKRAGCGSFNYQLAFDASGLRWEGSAGGATSGIDMPYGRWVHLAGTYDGTTFRLYMDGQLIKATVAPLGPTVSGPLKIGGSGDCGNTFSGLMDEVAIYNRALSQSEIQSIYNAGTVGRCTTSLKLTSANTFGGSGDQRATGISIADGAAYVSGVSGSNGEDGLIAKFQLPATNAQSITWSTNWPGQSGGDHFNAVIAVPGDGVYVTGDSYSQTTDTQGAKQARGMTVKFPFSGPTGSNIGGSIWAKQTPATAAYSYGGTEVLNGSVAVKEGTNTYIYSTGAGQNALNNTGRLFLTKMKSDSTIVWTATDPSTDTSSFSIGRGVATLNGAVYVGGRSGVSGSTTFGSDSVAFLKKYNSTGSLAWSQTTSGQFNGVTAFGGAIYAVGFNSNDGTNSMIAKYDESGRPLWTQDYDNGPQSVLNAVVGLGTRLYAVGFNRQSYESSEDIMILEIDPETGDQISAAFYGVESVNETATGVSTDGTDLYIVGGASGSDTDAILLRYQVAQPIVPLAVSTTVLSPAEVNKNYSTYLQASGGKPPFTWTLATGELPAGIVLNTNGLLSGVTTGEGTFPITVGVTDSASSPQTASQTLLLQVLASNDLPVVSITSPANGYTFTAPASISVSVNASDRDGIDHVELLGRTVNGEQVFASLRDYPYTTSINDLGAGSYVFRAIAYDTRGASSSSDYVSIRVNEAGTTVIDFEALNTASGDARGATLDGYLASFGVFTTNTGPTLVVNSQSNILGGSVVNASSGRNVFTQTNANGKVSYSIGFDRNITSFGFTRAQLLSGARGVSHPYWRATAYDATGVELGSVGEELISSFTNVPAKNFRLDGPDIKWVKIESDNRSVAAFGSAVLDDFVIYTILANNPPTVYISSPSDRDSFTSPADVTISASAFDSDGTVQQVSFYSGSALVGASAFSSPSVAASITLSRLAPGDYSVRAVATDNGGAVRSSVPVNFTVTAVAGVKVINFDSLDASSRHVGGSTLSNYLAGFGVTVANTAIGTRVEAADVKNLAGGSTVTPPSWNNVLTEVGSVGSVAYTLRFDSPQQSVQWTRPALNSSGASITHPAWKARVFNISGTELATVNESAQTATSSSPVVSKVFKLIAADIAWIRFESTSTSSTTFPAVLVDDIILDANTTVNPLNVTLTAPTEDHFTAPANITVSATASAANSIARVEFYAGSILIGSDSTVPYSIVWSNVLAGSYVLKARVVDSTGFAQWSGSQAVEVAAGVSGDATIINFDSLDANLGSVSGSPLASYLAGFGITTSDTTASSTLVVQKQSNINGGSVVEAASSPNIFTETGSSDTMQFSLNFSQPLQSFQFTRPKLKARSTGITHPAWTAYAYDASGTLLNSLSADFISSYTDVDSAVYVLQGLGIQKVTFQSDNRHSAAFNAVLLDDLVLTRMSSNLPPIVTITAPVAGNIFFAPATLTFLADAYDLDGSITNVQFFIGTTNVGTVTTAPYSVTLNNLAVGRYNLSAVASDNSGATRTSSTVSIKVEPSPTVFGILEQPANQEVAPGSTAIFSVLTTEIGTLQYQWRRNGSILNGKTDSVLTIENAQSANAGSYSVVVSSIVGSTTNSITSDTATLSIVVVPTITTQPQGQTADQGDSVEFTVAATGAAPLGYQWFLNGNRISGATSSSLALSEVTFADSGNYTVVVANRIGSVRSDKANLAVTIDSGISTAADNFADRLEINPLFDAVMANNSDATLEPSEPVHAGKTGGKSIWFTWHASFSGVITLTTRGSSFDTLMAVYTGSSLDNLTPVASDDDSGGNLTSRVTFNCLEGTDYQIAVDGFYGAFGNVIVSMPANGYRVLDAAFNDEQIPVITTQPESRSLLEGQNVTLTVQASSVSALSYQWQFEGSPILNETNSSFSITGFDRTFVGHYNVIVANEFGSVESESANLQLIFADVADHENVSSEDKFASAQNVGIQSSSFPPPKPGTGHAGSTRGFTTTQVFSTVGSTKEEGEPNHAGEPGGASEWFAYTAPTNGVLHVTTIANFNTVIAVYTGDGVDFESLVLKGSDNSSSGNGGDTVTVSNIVKNVTYYIAVDGVNGTSGNVELGVNLGDPVSITSSPQSKITAVGGSAVFSVVASGSTNSSGGYGYQWRFNGANISGATQSSYTRSNAQNSHVGGYSVVISNLINVVTSTPSASLTIQVPPLITTQPESKTVEAGSSLSIKATVAGGSPLTYKWRFNGATIAGATKSSLSINPVQTTNAGTYTLVITNVVGAITSAPAVITVNVPMPKLVSPKSGSVVSNTTVTISGTISDKARISQVKFSVNGAPFSTATGTASWSGSANLASGTNTITLKAIDASNHESSETNYTLFCFQQALLTLHTTGHGTIIPTQNSIFGNPTNNAPLALGKIYNIKASADAGWLFTNWTSSGSIVGSDVTYSFLMTNGLTVTANFITNPFVAAEGKYYGLLFDSNNVSHHSSGFFYMKPTSKKKFSSKLVIDGDELQAVGTLQMDGTGEYVISRTNLGKSNILMNLRLLFWTDKLTATLSNMDSGDPWVVTMNGNRAYWDKTARPATTYTNSYTMAVPGFNDETGPAGWSYLTVSIGNDGKVKAEGYSADGNKIKQTTLLSKTGEWPLYIPMYPRVITVEGEDTVTYDGSMHGWISIATNTPAGKTTRAPLGDVRWVKLSGTSGYYDNGFTNNTTVLGSKYAKPASKTRVLPLLTGKFRFSGGNLASSFTNNFSLGTDNKFTVAGANSVTAAFDAKGFLKTSSSYGFTHPANPGIKTTIYGVALPDYNYARGFFLGTNAGGALRIDSN